MIPVSAFSVSAEAPYAGQVVIPIERGPAPPRMLFDYQRELFALVLGQDGNFRFGIEPAQAVPIPMLVVKKPRLEIDYQSGFTAIAGDPQPGDAYMNQVGHGLIGKTAMGVFFVALEGPTLMGMPDNGRGFIAYTGWRLVIDLPNNAGVAVIAEALPR